MTFFWISWIVIGYIGCLVLFFDYNFNLKQRIISSEELIGISLISLLIMFVGYFIVPFLICYFVYKKNKGK